MASAGLMRQRILNVLLALDRFANALMLGSPEETISARAARWAARQDRGVKKRIGTLLCGALNTIDPGHCDNTTHRARRETERRVDNLMPYQTRQRTAKPRQRAT